MLLRTKTAFCCPQASADHLSTLSIGDHCPAIEPPRQPAVFLERFHFG